MHVNWMKEQEKEEESDRLIQTDVDQIRTLHSLCCKRNLRC